MAGKRTFRNLARYMEITEHTFARQMSKMFDFVGLNTELIKALKTSGDILIAAQDASFIAKSGKETHGLDMFWNGCASKAEKGLEIDVIAVVKVGEKNESYSLSSKQTPTNPIPKSERKKKKTTEQSKVDHYLNHLKEVAVQLLDLGIKYIAADAFLAKYKYINGAVALGLHAISKFRKDARFRRLYNGPPKKRGRKKKFVDGAIHCEDFTDSIITKLDSEQIELHSCTIVTPSVKTRK